MAKVIIIGGGVSGLSAGIFALEKGHEVAIFEKHFIAGGNLTGWKRQGHEIDNCIHWLTGTNPMSKFYNLWQRVGVITNDDSLYKPNSFYTVYDGANTLTMSRDIEKTKRDMLSLSKEDESEINNLISAVKCARLFNGTAINEKGKSANFFDKIKFIRYAIKYHALSLEELSEKFKHPTLKKVCTGFLGKNLTALGLIIAYADFTSGNGDIVSKGSYFASKQMVEKFKKLGGTLLTNKQAVAVHKSKNKIESVEFSDGTRCGADFFIFATDCKTTYEQILKMPMEKILNNRYNSNKWQKFSAVSVAFSVEGEVPFEMEAIISISKENQNKLNGEFLAVREFSYFKNFAPSGKNVLVSMIQCDQKTCKEWISLYGDKEEYKNKKQEIALAQIEEIEKTFPTLKGKIQILDSWTPYTYQKFTGECDGAFMSFIVGKKSVPLKSSNRVKNLKNVVLASQWLQPPGGLPIALYSGYKGVKTMEKMLNRKQVFATQEQKAQQNGV